jgi:arginase
MRRVELLGIPMDLGQDRRGVDVGPSAIRYARLAASLEELGYEVHDRGNVELPPPETTRRREEAPHLATIREVCERTAEATEGIASDGSVPCFLGGDHSVSIGTASGVAKAGRTGVLWVDAHADFNTPDTSPSGNVHGMPLGTIVGRGHPELHGIGGGVHPEDVALVGLRSVDREELRLLLDSGVRVYTMKEIDAYGMASVVRRALDDLSYLGRVHLSLDVDAVDPTVAPGVGTPVAGGLSYREAHLLMELASESGLVTSLDVVEVNPILDERNRTAELAVELAGSLMGRGILSLPR